MSQLEHLKKLNIYNNIRGLNKQEIQIRKDRVKVSFITHTSFTLNCLDTQNPGPKKTSLHDLSLTHGTRTLVEFARLAKPCARSQVLHHAPGNQGRDFFQGYERAPPFLI